MYLTGIPFPSDSTDLGFFKGRSSFQKGLFLLTSTLTISHLSQQVIQSCGTYV